MDVDVASLPDTMCPVCCLQLHCWVPVEIQHEDMVATHQIQTFPSRHHGQQHHLHTNTQASSIDSEVLIKRVTHSRIRVGGVETCDIDTPLFGGHSGWRSRGGSGGRGRVGGAHLLSMEVQEMPAESNWYLMMSSRLFH